MHLKLVIDTHFQECVEHHHKEAAKHEAALEMHLEAARLYYLNRADEGRQRGLEADDLSRQLNAASS